MIILKLFLSDCSSGYIYILTSHSIEFESGVEQYYNNLSKETCETSELKHDSVEIIQPEEQSPYGTPVMHLLI